MQAQSLGIQDGEEQELADGGGSVRAGGAVRIDPALHSQQEEVP
jgi:hypothetical protein